METVAEKPKAGSAGDRRGAIPGGKMQDSKGVGNNRDTESTHGRRAGDTSGNSKTGAARLATPLPMVSVRDWTSQSHLLGV